MDKPRISNIVECPPVCHSLTNINKYAGALNDVAEADDDDGFIVTLSIAANCLGIAPVRSIYVLWRNYDDSAWWLVQQIMQSALYTILIIKATFRSVDGGAVCLFAGLAWLGVESQKQQKPPPRPIK